MTATAHALIGAIIAAKIPNPYIAIPLAVISHVAADIFPHWDSGTNGESKTKQRLRIEATIDVLLGFLLSYIGIFWLFPNTDPIYTFIIIIASQSLDWITMPYYFFNIKYPVALWMYKMQKGFNSKLDKPWGIINQVLVIVFIIILAKLF
ncbi:MAG: hypothetical protein A3F31_04215 [Candidatus Levybacteria bacterium RIFCSPHIGHO2_12_FULL_38_12]|nr:MAG: hypothetical protein A3F31_04215 [Candidatus Levybacteria bacterium RIFCSPHIGHO2_12_FULL_38_12]OGH34402.1 MAG: hypothetical protein A3A47_04610 [Candidatus Levybacteria bacterium RIFCSPLOWO2_01_FULL_37_20]OGH44414.1 MAG: hypothetical protein A3J14_03100 [Candidatus Levybacteria bacterium RIFCSPLOWO2_02_FULL_37_18]OGH51660.1 MAG: hypothetical protein A3G13_03360 [Candidatus Levybacteria bacterium RIFCSPLOWO2_12_FULL_37_7]